MLQGNSFLVSKLEQFTSAGKDLVLAEKWHHHLLFRDFLFFIFLRNKEMSLKCQGCQMLVLHYFII